jgi:hypothetical protein
MPRTARFFTTLQEAFGDNEECVITQEPLGDIRGGLLQVDDANLKQPYACDAMLKWFDMHPTHPLTRAPLRIRMLHPVMTPQTDMADYTHAVRVLAGCGWDLEDEVEQDVRARAPAWKRDRGALYDPHEPALTRDRAVDALYDPREVLREVLRADPWWVFTHTEEERGARRALDVRYMREALCAIDQRYDQQLVRNAFVFSLQNVRFLIRHFLRHRKRMWRFSEGEQTYPIYMRIVTLTDDFCWMCGALFGWKVDYDQYDTINEAKTLGRGTRYKLRDEAEESMRITTVDRCDVSEDAMIVLYPPSIDQWMRGIALPRVLTMQKWTVFRPQCDVARDVFLMSGGCGFKFELADVENALRRCMTEVDGYVYRRPSDTRMLDAGDPLEHWLETTALPLLHLHYEPTWTKTSEDIAKYFRLNHDPCPFSQEALQSVIERTFERIATKLYKISEEDARHIRKDPSLLPSDPYVNPLLLPALQYGLERMQSAQHQRCGRRI